jgi:hypothetical protein
MRKGGSRRDDARGAFHDFAGGPSRLALRGIIPVALVHDAISSRDGAGSGRSSAGARQYVHRLRAHGTGYASGAGSATDAGKALWRCTSSRSSRPRP